MQLFSNIVFEISSKLELLASSSEFVFAFVFLFSSSLLLSFVWDSLSILSLSLSDISSSYKQIEFVVHNLQLLEHSIVMSSVILII